MGEPVATQTIRIPGPWVFEPANAVVEAGVPVTFRNDGGADHTVTMESLDLDVVVEPGGETTYTFTEPGTYEYTCKYHPPGMKGIVTVVAAQPQEGVTPSASSADSSAPSPST